MSRGFGNCLKQSRCVCEEKDINNWRIIHKSKVSSGKNFGKTKAIIYCYKCNHQWETMANYIKDISDKGE